MRIILILLLLLAFAARAFGAGPPLDRFSPDYHLVGWVNTILPGAGQMFLGNYQLGGFQAAAEVGTFGWGYSLSRLSPLTIDGVPEELPAFKIRRPNSRNDLSKALYADLLQEFGLKYHMVNVFEAYRDAARQSGVTERIDQTPTRELFLKPFSPDVLSDPFVFVPIGLIAGYAMADYYISRQTINRNQKLTPYSNALYAVNYDVAQPFGSGAPEELFFRGFLQNEIYNAVRTGWIAVPSAAALFALAHAPGDGRITAGVSGLYLGWLAQKNHGLLAQGIAVHFWGVVFLGLETILLNHEAQRTLPPTGFSVQINY